MPLGTEQSVPKNILSRRLGTSLAIGGEIFDIGELLEIIIGGGVGPADLASLEDVALTQVATWFNDSSPFMDKYDDSLPPLIGTNQDVIVQFGDFSIALMAKALGGALGGFGISIGIAVDVATTIANLILENYFIIGTPFSLDFDQVDPDQWGLTYIIIFPP